MSTPGVTTILPATVFSALPSQLASELTRAFKEIVTNFSQGRWEPAELNGGKLCEAAYTICEGLCSGSMPPSAQKPGNMPAACRALETRFPQAVRSPRIQIPRMIVALYEIRNNRGVGHIGGDVDPNHMDAVCVLQMSKWIVAELVRVLHQTSVDEATELVDALVEREVPLVWKFRGMRRVLDPSMSMRDKTLLLLHSCAGTVAEADLVSWVEHPNAAVYRRDTLRKCHKSRLIEYDETERTALLSPRGVRYVEEDLIARLAL